MLFKSLWFVLVLVASISATPDTDDNNLLASQHEVEEIALPVLKRQEPSWRNDTKTPIPSTPTREPSPVVLSSSSSAEPQKPTPVSTSDKVSLVDGTSTRSLFSSPEGSPSASNGPITSTNHDVSSSSVAAISSHSTHMSSAQQQQETSTLTSFQGPPQYPSSGQATSVSESIVSPAQSSTVRDEPPVSFPTPTSTPAQEESSLGSTQIIVSSASSSAVIPGTPTPTPSPEEPSPSSQVEIITISTTQQGPSAIESSSVVQQSPPWEVPSPSSIVTPSSAITWYTEPAPVSISNSDVPSATPPSETATVSSESIPPWISPSASEQLSPLPSATASLLPSDPPELPSSSLILGPSETATVSLISAAPEPSSSVLLDPSQTLTEQTPEPPTATTFSAPAENSQVFSSLIVTGGPFITASSSSIAELPLLSSLAPVVSNTLEGVLSSVLPSQTEGSAYFSASETLSASIPSEFPTSSSVPLPVASGTLTIGPTATAASQTPITSSNTDVVPASETLSGQPSASPVLSGLPSLNGTATNPASLGGSATTLVSNTLSVASASFNATSTAVLNAVSATGTGLSTNTSAVESISKLTAGDLTLTATLNTTFAGTPQAASTRTIQSPQGWNSSSTPVENAALSTGLTITPTATWSNASQTAPPEALNNSTIVNSLLDASNGVSASSVSPTINSNLWITQTIPTPVSPTGPATSTAAASSPAPPLTTPQKAGVVIAGFAGFLLALVAVVYLVRRRYNGRRSSSGSIYPKEAYIYDPRADSSGRDDETLMSGGLSGLPLMRGQARAPSSTPEYGYRHSTGTMSTIFSEGSNPFGNSQDAYEDSYDPLMTTPTDSAAAFSAAIRGYGAGPSGTNDWPATQSSRDMAFVPPTTRSVVRGATPGNRGSILSEIASIAYNPRVYPNPHASRYEQLEPYGLHSNQSLHCVRETRYSDSNGATSEQDLPLHMDLQGRTSDYMTLYAPPPISNALIGATQPPRGPSNNPWASSMLAPTNMQSSASPLRRVVEQRSLSPSMLSPNATLVESDRYSLAYNREKSTTYITPSQHQSPMSPPSAPMHKGWEDIKRYSGGKVVPSPVSLSPPLGYWGQPPTKKQSLPQIRRKDGQLFGSPDATRSSDRLPQKPFSHKKSSSVPTATLDQTTKLDTGYHNDDLVRSPDTTFQRGVNSFRPFMQRKKTGDLEFSCAGV